MQVTTSIPHHSGLLKVSQGETRPVGNVLFLDRAIADPYKLLAVQARKDVRFESAPSIGESRIRWA